MIDRTPSAVDVTIGGETRIYEAFVTTAPATLDRPSTVTLEESSFAKAAGLAAEPIAFDAALAERPARLVLIASVDLELQKACYREGRYLLAPADPVLVGRNTLQHWLWDRLAMPSDPGGALMARETAKRQRNPKPRPPDGGPRRRSHHEHLREDHPQRSHGAWQARGRRTPLHRRRARWPEADRFAIWARKDGTGQNVTFPARQFTTNGQRRSFFLLRAISDPAAQDRLRDFVLQAYRAHEQKVSQAAS